MSSKQCNYLFVPSGHSRHERGQGPGRRFQCSNCSYSTNLKGDFKRHQLTHTGEKPHACPVCKKCFSLKGNLQAHLYLHDRQADHSRLNLCMTIGARDVKILVCNILRKLMSDDVGERYSLTGKSKGEKLAFEKTETYKLILEICFRSFNDFKVHIVREAMSNWLMQSKFRKSKRENRPDLKKTDSIVTAAK